MIRCAVAVLAAWLFATAALAQTAGPASVAPAGFDRQAALDPLFEALKKAETETEARLVVQDLRRVFLTAPDAESAEDMNRAMRAMGGYSFDKATEFLNAAIERHPTYAEAWNLRATVRFLQRDWDASLADCERVLALEQRHIGCLSGMALMYVRHLKQYDKGRQAIARAEALHPFVPERYLLAEIPDGE